VPCRTAQHPRAHGTMGCRWGCVGVGAVVVGGGARANAVWQRVQTACVEEEVFCPVRLCVNKAGATSGVRPEPAWSEHWEGKRYCNLQQNAPALPRTMKEVRVELVCSATGVHGWQVVCGAVCHGRLLAVALHGGKCGAGVGHGPRRNNWNAGCGVGSQLARCATWCAVVGQVVGVAFCNGGVVRVGSRTWKCKIQPKQSGVWGCVCSV